MPMERKNSPSDLALTPVAAVGRLVETSEDAEPYRLLDPLDVVVQPVQGYFRELQATGRSVAPRRRPVDPHFP